MKYKTRELTLEATIQPSPDSHGVFIFTPGNYHCYIDKRLFLELFEPVPEEELTPKQFDVLMNNSPEQKQ